MEKGKERSVIVLTRDENPLDVLKELGSERIRNNWIFIHESCFNGETWKNLVSNEVTHGKRTMIFKEENSSKALQLNTDCVWKFSDETHWEWLLDILFGEPTGYGQEKLYIRPTDPFSLEEEIQDVIFLIMEDAEELQELKAQGYQEIRKEVFIPRKDKNLLEIFEELGMERISKSWVLIHESVISQNEWEDQEGNWKIAKKEVRNELWSTKRLMLFKSDDGSHVAKICTDFSWAYDCDDSWDWLDTMDDDSSNKYSRPYGKIPKSLILIVAEEPYRFYNHKENSV